MLKLCNIVKDYPTATTTVHALRGVSLVFRQNEFVAILGPSGCGKTTMLNIIGGLDRYTSGDLVVGGVSTANFDDEHWDAYRNATIGFVFQSYNLIPHLTVLENVELALSLVGEKKKVRREKAIQALHRVNMDEEINKRPNQLSGGQMQRVAIARAIVNDPKIILADEPTGALDSELSVQVMDILQEISKSCLVIMVTHNGELAKNYCSRICRFKDGQLIEDTNPYDIQEEKNESAVLLDKAQCVDDAVDVGAITTDTLSLQNNDINSDFAQDVAEQTPPVDTHNPHANEEHSDESVVEQNGKKVSNHKRKVAMRNMADENKVLLDRLGIQSKKESKKKQKQTFKPTSMSAGMAFGLSLRNLVSKRRRTFFTAFAGSIGIIGLALVLAISNGFNIFVENMQTEMFNSVPLGIYQYNINDSAIMDTMLNMATSTPSGEVPDDDKIIVQNISDQASGMGFISTMMSAFFDGVTRNDLSYEFAQYMGNMPSSDYATMSIYYGVRYNMVAKTFDSDGNIKYVDASQVASPVTATAIATTVLGESGMQPKNWQVLVGDESTMMASYEYIGEGRYPQNMNEILLCVDESNHINQSLLDLFGFDCYVTDDDGNIVLGEDGKPVKIDELTAGYFVGKTIKLVHNNAYYTYNEEDARYDLPDNFLSTSPYDEWAYTNQDKLKELYDNAYQTLTIVGVVRHKAEEGKKYVESGLCYTPELAEYVLDQAYNSEVAQYQRSICDVNASTGETIFGTYYDDKDVTSEATIISVLSSSLTWSGYLKCIGAVKSPLYISVYPQTYSQKVAISNYIADWTNHGGTSSVGFFDVSAMFIYNLNVILNLVSVMLIAVASISLVVSTVMIGVITSNSVIERTREIGILRSLGARKKDIRSVFIAETSIIGLFSGLLGIAVTYVLAPLISLVINAVVGIPGLLRFHPLHALLLVVLSLVLTVISGIIPAINASRKNVVDALRVD